MKMKYGLLIRYFVPFENLRGNQNSQFLQGNIWLIASDRLL